MNYDALLADAGVVPLERKGLRLLSVEAIRRLLPLLRTRDVVVLGLEGFHVTPRDVQPRMDQIADFSSAMDLPPEQRSRVSVGWATDFLNSTADTTVVFDLSIATDC
jgi:hypothetical protein